MRTIKSILCATDFSPQSRNALDTAFGLARDYGAMLNLLYVQQPPEVSEGEFGMPPPPAEPSEEMLLDQLRALLPDLDTVNVQLMVGHGMPAEEIVRAATKTHCDLIVLGTHEDHGWVSELFHTNVVEEVKRSAPCEVLAVESATPATL